MADEHSSLTDHDWALSDRTYVCPCGASTEAYKPCEFCGAPSIAMIQWEVDNEGVFEYWDTYVCPDHLTI